VNVNGGKLFVTASNGNTAVAGTLGVTGDVTVNGGKLSVAANDGSLNVNSGKFTVDGTNGNTAVAGTLGVTGATTLTGALNANGDVNVNSGKLTVSATNGNTAVAGTLSAGATTVDSATVTGAASFGGEFSTAYAAVIASGGTATCTDAKSVCVVTNAGGASDGGWTVTYGGGSPATGTMVFVRNGSGVDTASTAFGTGTAIEKNTGALFVYSGSAWTRII